MCGEAPSRSSQTPRILEIFDTGILIVGTPPKKASLIVGKHQVPRGIAGKCFGIIRLQDHLVTVRNHLGKLMNTWMKHNSGNSSAAKQQFEDTSHTNIWMAVTENELIQTAIVDAYI